MKFTEWWETKGLEEYRARCKDVGVEPTPDGEWIAKHCAWAAWLDVPLCRHIDDLIKTLEAA